MDLMVFFCNTGTIPDEWRSALVVPVFKKGDRHQASNYRPVSLTSIACKLLEHIVHSQVMDHYDGKAVDQERFPVVLLITFLLLMKYGHRGGLVAVYC
jgi:hypothetical protein